MIVLVFIGVPAETDVTVQGWGSKVPPPPSVMIGASLDPRLHNSCC